MLHHVDTSESGQDITVHVEKDGKILVDGHRVVEKDILAANGNISIYMQCKGSVSSKYSFVIIGVLHVVDDLPYADTLVFDTRKYLFGLNATKFVSLVDEYGLGRFLNEGANNVTILAPTNEVLDQDDIPNNQKVQWLSYHIVQGAWEPHDLEDHMLLKTEYNSSQLYSQSQRLLVAIGKDESRAQKSDRKGLLKSIRFGDHSRVIGDDSKSLSYINVYTPRCIRLCLLTNKIHNTTSVCWRKCHLSHIRPPDSSYGYI